MRIFQKQSTVTGGLSGRRFRLIRFWTKELSPCSSKNAFTRAISWIFDDPVYPDVWSPLWVSPRARLTGTCPRCFRGRVIPSNWATSLKPAWFLKDSISPSICLNMTFCHDDVASCVPRRTPSVTCRTLVPLSRRAVVFAEELPNVQEGHDQKVECVEANGFDREPSIAIRGIAALDLNPDLGDFAGKRDVPRIG